MINFSRPVPSRLVWDNVLPPFLSHQKWSKALEEEAINITKFETVDEMGVLHLLYPPEDFLCKFGKAPIVLAKPPKVPAGASRADIANSVNDNAEFNVQQQAGSTILSWMLATIPQEYLDLMMENDSICTRSMEYIFTNLRKNIGPLTAQDLDELKLALTVVHVYPASVLAHVTRFMKYLGYLEAAKQKVSNFDAVSIMKRGFDHHTYLDCFVDFAKKFPEVELQTPAALGEAIILYTKTVLPVRLGSVISGASAIPVTPTGYIAISDVQDIIQQALVANDARKSDNRRDGCMSANVKPGGDGARTGVGCVVYHYFCA